MTAYKNILTWYEILQLKNFLIYGIHVSRKNILDTIQNLCVCNYDWKNKQSINEPHLGLDVVYWGDLEMGMHVLT